MTRNYKCDNCAGTGIYQVVKYFTYGHSPTSLKIDKPCESCDTYKKNRRASRLIFHNRDQARAWWDEQQYRDVLEQEKDYEWKRR